MESTPPTAAGSRSAPGRLRAWGPLVLLWVLFVSTGLRGIDLGKHWDEGLQRYQIERMVTGGDLLQGEYHYPGLLAWIAFVGGTPTWRVAWEAPEVGPEQRALQKELKEGPWLLRTRTLCLLFTSLALVGLHAALLRLTGRALPAFLGSSALAVSWELGYHARWVAPDGLVVAAGAWVLWGAARFLAREPQARRAPLLAAAAAGLAAAAKYTGGLWLLLPLGLALAEPGDARRRVLAAGRVLAVAAAVFLCITPGALLEADVFLEGLAYERDHYARGHFGHTVVPGLPHAALMLRYLFGELPAALPAVRVGSLALAGLGALAVLTGSGLPPAGRRLGRLSLLLGALFLAYHTGLRVLFVRNLLLVLPVFGLLVGLGGAAGLEHLRQRAGRIAERGSGAVLAGLGVLALVLAGVDQWRAAVGVAQRDPRQRLAQLEAFLDQHPGRTVYLSAELREARRAAGLGPRPELREERPEDCDYVALVTGERELRGPAAKSPDPAEPAHGHDWPSNRPGWASAVLGPREVHWAWYTAWLEPHTIVLDRAAYAQLRAYDWRSLLPSDGR